MEQGYRQIFKQREFMKMTGANFINRFGHRLRKLVCDYAGCEYDTKCARSALRRSDRGAYGEKEHHDCL